MMRVERLQIREQRSLFLRERVLPQWSDLPEQTRRELTKLLARVFVESEIRAMERSQRMEISDDR